MTLKKAIRHWRVKGVIQGLLGVAPGGGWVNDRLQTTLGDLGAFDTNIGKKVDNWAGVMACLNAAHRSDVGDRTILEIGTGWYPTLPLCFALAGARCVYTVDLTRHLSAPLTFRMLRALEPHLDRIEASSRLPPGAVREVFNRLLQSSGLEQLLAMAHVEYRAPADAANLDWLPADSLDMAYSNSVLEHVAPGVIPAIMRESFRVLKGDGVIVHAVACNDHYAHFDKDISFVNYLQYSDRQWRPWNNRLNYQNRLRAPDFITCAQESGFRILHDARAIRPGTREALARMRVAPQFCGYALDDLASTSVNFVAAKPALQR